MYQNNWSNNRLQKTFSIYFKFKCLTAKGLIFDVLHALGLIFSQRLENLQKLTSGTAATAYLKPGATPLPASANQDLKEQRAANLDSPITIRRVLDLAGCQQQESPDFDLSTYKFKDHTLLQRPPPPNPLPIGKDAKSMQYLLSSVNQSEASYCDHVSLIDEWLKQLHMYGGQTWIFRETRENWRKKCNFKRSTEERAMGGDAASDVSQDSEHSDEQIEEYIAVQYLHDASNYVHISITVKKT
ncbi:hypothetical protein R3P38DRAFT_2815612 [Favolaschia claudopus]|uniref:DUF6589 domain-containing protein n=1 Tax=Favolaschia claudopus TaxID=2862362 RepID=A0AAV9Z0X2_9AGAR